MATTVVIQLVISRLLESHDNPIVHTRVQLVRLTSPTVTTHVVTGGSVSTSGFTPSTRNATTLSTSPQRPPSWFHRPLVCLEPTLVPTLLSHPANCRAKTLAETPLSVEASEVNSPSLRTTRLASTPRQNAENVFPGNRNVSFQRVFAPASTSRLLPTRAQAGMDALQSC